jgi:ribosomal protein L1
VRVRVKVCGITRAEDAAAAVEAGADAIGLNFVDESPRRLRDDRAEQVAVAIPPFVARVGVFANAPVDRVRLLARGCTSTPRSSTARRAPRSAPGCRCPGSRRTASRAISTR